MKQVYVSGARALRRALALVGLLPLLDRWAADAGRAAAARGVVGIVDFEAPWPLDAWAARIAGGADALRVVASVWPEALDGPKARWGTIDG